MSGSTREDRALALDRVRFRVDGHAILDDVSLHAVPGQLTALLGPNGAGKSTLLAIAAGDLRPTSGTVMLAGRALRDWPARALARQRAVMPQDHAVRFGFSVREVVAMGRLPHPPDPEADARIIGQALASADIEALAARDVQTLSGGESARTTFARVLAQRTPLLLLDEPTAALDLHHQERLMHAIRGLVAEGACVLVVMHDLNLAARHADRIVLLDRGRIAADGAPHEVLRADTIERVYRQRVSVLAHPTRDIPLVVVGD